MFNKRLRATVETGHRGTTAHAEFLIEHFRVGYAFGGGWTCECAAFAASDACRHTQEGAGRYFAQKLIAAHVTHAGPRTLTAHGHVLSPRAKR
jgi:hypothetical protein